MPTVDHNCTKKAISHCGYMNDDCWMYQLSTILAGFLAIKPDLLQGTSNAYINIEFLNEGDKVPLSWIMHSISGSRLPHCLLDTTHQICATRWLHCCCIHILCHIAAAQISHFMGYALAVPSQRLHSSCAFLNNTDHILLIPTHVFCKRQVNYISKQHCYWWHL